MVLVPITRREIIWSLLVVYRGIRCKLSKSMQRAEYCVLKWYGGQRFAVEPKKTLYTVILYRY